MAQVTKVAMNGHHIDQEQFEIWDYAFGFTQMAVFKCAIQLQIADVLEAHGGSMTHADLSSAVGCSPPLLRRIMRYLINRRFFTAADSSYAQTPRSRMLMKNSSNSIAALILLESSPVMLAPWHRLTSAGAPPFVAAHGRSVWEYASSDPVFNKQFNDGIACITTHCMEAVIHKYPEAFNGMTSLVDVGGGDGTSLRSVVKACPWIIRGINLDLPHVISAAPHSDGIDHVAGDMFDLIPKADAVFLKHVLHNWSDLECIHILKKCGEAIPEKRGKVIIAEAVIREEEEEEFNDMSLALDMTMLAYTDKGKERTYKEWEYLLNQAGFTNFKVKNIHAIISVIEAYP